MHIPLSKTSFDAFHVSHLSLGRFSGRRPLIEFAGDDSRENLSSNIQDVSVLFHCRDACEIGRFFAWDPLDIAADARTLFRQRAVTREKLINGISKIASGDGLSIIRAAGVKLAAVNQGMVLIEYKKIRCAGSFVGLGNILGAVVEVRKRVSCGFVFFRHFGRAVIGMRSNVVRADADDGNTFGLVIFGELGQTCAQMLNERTVVTHEDDHQSPGCLEVIDRNDFSIDIGERKRRCGGSERQHRRRGFYHNGLFLKRV